jgi:hypothetical protein
VCFIAVMRCYHLLVAAAVVNSLGVDDGQLMPHKKPTSLHVRKSMS